MPDAQMRIFKDVFHFDALVNKVFKDASVYYSWYPHISVQLNSLSRYITTLHHFLTIFTLLFTTTTAQEVDDVAAAREKYNVVFVLTDDQDQRMDSLTHMPKVQKLLIDKGTWYRRYYAPTSFCCPARVSIWTGLHAHNHKVTSVSGKWGGWPKVLQQDLNSKYLPIWFRQNGYKTYYA